LSASLTRPYHPVVFKPGQIGNAFKKLPGFLHVDEKKCSLTIHVTHANGIRETKNIGWNDLDTISELDHNGIHCVLFSYNPIGDNSCIIYIESRYRGDLFIHCDTSDMNKTSALVSILEQELRLEIEKDGEPSDDESQEQQYVDKSRLHELKEVPATRFDLSRLIKILEELNICHRNHCDISVITLTRSLLDHVPPIFSCKTFSEIANSYAASKSFRESMKHLENSSRKIADQYLHTQIRQKESLPNRTQVNFSNDIDVLLSEIVRVLK
jgi:hypothetical protein